MVLKPRNGGRVGVHAAGVRIWFVARSSMQVPLHASPVPAHSQKPFPRQSALVLQGAHVPCTASGPTSNTPLAQSLWDTAWQVPFSPSDPMTHAPLTQSVATLHGPFASAPGRLIGMLRQSGR